jgi:hypothetical protein
MPQRQFTVEGVASENFVAQSVPSLDTEFERTIGRFTTVAAAAGIENPAQAARRIDLANAH